jgi:hypothetical protein
VDQVRKILHFLMGAVSLFILFFGGSALRCQPFDSLLNHTEQWKNRNLIKGLTVDACIRLQYNWLTTGDPR